MYPYTGLSCNNNSEDPQSEYKIKLITGNANRPLAEEVCRQLNVPLQECEVGQFANGEISIHVKHNIRGSDVFILQPTCGPDINTRLMELLLLIHTLRLSSAKRITAVIPHFGYARQDRKVKPRVPISASAVAQLITCMGVDRVITLDLHCDQIQGFFHNTPVDNLFAETEFTRFLRAKDFDLSKLVIVSPDAGGVTRARRVADALDASAVVTILKRRSKANQIDSMQIAGDVKGFICVIVDDMIDTAGTLTKAAQLLVDNGATKVIACASHGIFSESALERINQSVIEEVVVTDSIPQTEHVKQCSKIHVITVGHLLAEAILRVHNEKSLSALFKLHD